MLSTNCLGTLPENLSVRIYRCVLQNLPLQSGRGKVALFTGFLYSSGIRGIHFTRYGRGSTGGLLLSRRMPFWSSLKRAS